MPISGTVLERREDGTVEVRCSGPHPTLRFPGKTCRHPLVTYKDGALTFVCCKGAHVTIVPLDKLLAEFMSVDLTAA